MKPRIRHVRGRCGVEKGDEGETRQRANGEKEREKKEREEDGVLGVEGGCALRWTSIGQIHCTKYTRAQRGKCQQTATALPDLCGCSALSRGVCFPHL